MSEPSLSSFSFPSTVVGGTDVPLRFSILVLQLTNFIIFRFQLFSSIIPFPSVLNVLNIVRSLSLYLIASRMLFTFLICSILNYVFIFLLNISDKPLNVALGFCLSCFDRAAWLVSSI